MWLLDMIEMDASGIACMGRNIITIALNGKTLQKMTLSAWISTEKKKNINSKEEEEVIEVCYFGIWKMLKL